MKYLSWDRNIYINSSLYIIIKNDNLYYFFLFKLHKIIGFNCICIYISIFIEFLNIIYDKLFFNI